MFSKRYDRTIINVVNLSTVDTNRDASRIVVDNWLDIRLENAKLGEKLIIVVHQLRLMLKNLLIKKLGANKLSTENPTKGSEVYNMSGLRTHHL